MNKKIYYTVLLLQMLLLKSVNNKTYFQLLLLNLQIIKSKYCYGIMFAFVLGRLNRAQVTGIS